MKKGLSLLCGCLLAGSVVMAQEEQPLKENWHYGSFEQDGVYGADIDRALEFLKGKKAKHRPVVALIGAGIDLKHEALKDNVWTNRKEKADGKDNDKNGLVDDIHGWNFIGGKDGAVMERLMTGGNQAWLRLKDKYADLIFDGKDFYKYENEQRVKVAPPADMEEYKFFTWLLQNYETDLGSAYAGKVVLQECQRYWKKFFDKMRQKFPGKEKYSFADFQAANPASDFSMKKDSLEAVAFHFMIMGLSYTNSAYEQAGKTFDDLSSMSDYYERGGALKKAQEGWDMAWQNNGDDKRREIVGDDPYDINDRAYGNNVHLLANSDGCTVAAGIIAGKRGIEGRNQPICENAEIMALNVVNTYGDPYLKDMALAIRYAVEHGADVILCGLQQTTYPEEGKAWVSDALKLAEEKGVLVIFSVMEYAADMEMFPFYPNRFLTTPELTNFMVVAPSDSKGNPFIKSNFGDKEVDLFAPGDFVFTTFVGDSYQNARGTLVAGAMVAGVAALIKSYYPKLTGTQIRTLLNENVTSRQGVEVEKLFMSKDGKQKQDVYLFEQLCLTGGILNAYKAVQAADALAK